MTPRQSPRLAGLDRRGWWLWGLTFTVLIALTVTVLLLSLQVPVTSADRQPGLLDDGLAVVALTALMLLFCMHVGMQQRELDRTRGALRHEESELADTRTRLSELSELFEVSTSINLQLRLEMILEILVRRVVSALRAQQASVMMVDPASGVLETRASYGLESEFARHGRQRMGEGIAGWVAQQQQAVLVQPEDTLHGRFKENRKVHRHITSGLSLPLRVGDRCVGVLNVNRIQHPDPFTEHHREMLRLFAEHVGSVIERAEVMERLTARTQDLERANLQLAELNRMKDVFLSTASHELKTPLTSVIGYAELLEDRERRLSVEQQTEFLRRLRAEADALLALIEDILDLSKLETGKLVLQREPHELNDVVREAMGTSRALADKHGVELVEALAPDFGLLALDETKMRQVVVNLLVNAIKFSPARGRVLVRTQLESDFVVLEVEDCGPGVRPEDTLQIFELFGQGARQQEKRTSGLGIGLHLVRRITELHGGHVGVRGRAEGGSIFWVRLPGPAVERRALLAGSPVEPIAA